MTRILLTLLLGVFIAGPTWAQQADEGVDGAEVALDAELEAELEAEPEPEPESGPEEEAEEFDETGLDEQGFSNEDDDFRPSEVIPTDQSIEFPTDI